MKQNVNGEAALTVTLVVISSTGMGLLYNSKRKTQISKPQRKIQKWLAPVTVSGSEF